MLIMILLIVAIICLYLAISHAISDFYQYKYMAKMTELFNNKDTRQLFIYLKPYLEDYICLVRKQSEAFMKNSDAYREYVKIIEKQNEN